MPRSDERPIPPEFRAPQRVRYGIAPYSGSQTHVGTGWALLDGAWLHVVDDMHGVWSTWPARSVDFIEWDAAPFDDDTARSAPPSAPHQRDASS